MDVNKQLEMFSSDKKSPKKGKTDNMAEKMRLAQALLSNIEKKLETAIKLYNRQYVSKK